ncbi:hypothetical protein BIY23_01685 [Wolbachia pipientis]|uniref:Transposase Synechocystis PCC 6803 domain-containing protein n=1 Tax=Wolbachia pipientis TaxID=955 RepID=A0A1E7QL17_WOLPI|nr:hypothetical protein BIY23_01685 [Wolbachia pipientis]
MTTRPYSINLRKRVIKFIEEGGGQVKAAKIFYLNLSTVNPLVPKVQKRRQLPFQEAFRSKKKNRYYRYKDYATADKIREQLRQIGISISDNKDDTTTW